MLIAVPMATVGAGAAIFLWQRPCFGVPATDALIQSFGFTLMSVRIHG